MRATTVLAALLVFGLVPAICLAPPIDCGWVVNVSCPGCSPQAGGGCSCAKVGTSCDCKVTGGTTHVTCETGDFDWEYSNSANEGYRMAAGDEVPCAIIKKCMMAGGGTSDCATYDPQKNRCLQTELPCAWREFQTSEMTEFAQGFQCGE
ncbi:MAG: hypothetical protein KKB50_05325 [Planctomycetes bacterium]|nr:hypothetical protein [Planctomycetota bacterium]